MYSVKQNSKWDIRIDIQTDKPCELYVDTFPSEPKKCYLTFKKITKEVLSTPSSEKH